MAMTEIFLTTT